MVATLLFPFLLVFGPGSAQSSDDDGVSEQVRQGEYLLRAGGCVSCHTEKADDAPFLAGGRAIESPFGTFYGPNITPDPETGIGGWSEDDFARALRHGISPGGRHYYPAFPYTSYTRMRSEDIAALWAYLQTVEPVRLEDRAHELVWYARFRPGLRVWKFLHFRPAEFEPRPDATEEWNRGAYLSGALAHCAECHSPRTRTGGLDPERLYSGARMGDGDAAPNITPDRETGIGRWSPRHLMRYLDMGMDPDGDFAGGAMGDVIGEGTSHLTDEDRRALVVYLRELDPIENRVPPAD
ncbi:cytochrome c [Thioalkalivibrio sp.]|uniref:c-type cytochrome n=1 Tax=Thioalkalivibrio sp. TaxID=2093813 RepID=UPI0012D6FA2B|nr:cytochrome c [Thioalkalivibrio sp.]TVP78223.1 MAG: cytochrome C [Thioalkalivibrio sp.]